MLNIEQKKIFLNDLSAGGRTLSPGCILTWLEGREMIQRRTGYAEEGVRILFYEGGGDRAGVQSIHRSDSWLLSCESWSVCSIGSLAERELEGGQAAEDRRWATGGCSEWEQRGEIHWTKGSVWKLNIGYQWGRGRSKVTNIISSLC